MTDAADAARIGTAAAAGPRTAAAAAEPVAAADLTHLWVLPEHALAPFARELGGARLLTEAEQVRMDRMASAPARSRFLAGRLLCRYALSARTGRPLDAWRFRTGGYGRPEPEPDHGGVRFSLSRSEGFVACVVTQGRACGVDVERAPASADSADHLGRFFAADERVELSALRPAARIARTNELWVLKEAYLKALGTGLHRSLDGVSFAARREVGGTGRITVDDAERPQAAAGDAWRFDLLRPGPEHALAVAVEGAPPGALRRVDLSVV